MSRAAVPLMGRFVLVLALALAAGFGCTLLLATDELIVPCTSSAECDEGLECRENACLPVDEDESDTEPDGDGGSG